MKRRNDIYNTGNDYHQGSDYFIEHTYYDGIFHEIKDESSLNKRVINKLQSDWEKNPNGLIYSKDYAVTADEKQEDDESKPAVYTVVLTDENGNETELVMNFVNIPSQDVESIETQLTKINGENVYG